MEIRKTKSMERKKKIVTLESKSEVAKNVISKEFDKKEIFINVIPRANWMITTAFIEAQTHSMYAGGDYKPTFLNMQRVLEIGPRTTEVKVGDWVYIDMSRFIKTIKKQSKIRAGIGGAEMIEEQLVPPVFFAPGDENAYLKISDQEIEGVVKDPYKLKVEFSTMEAFLESQKGMVDEFAKAKAAHDKNSMNLVKEPVAFGKGPMIITSTSPNLKS